MRELYTFPPNYVAINRAFNVRGKPVIFTYGSVIHNPSRIKVPDHLRVHEEVHQCQQGNNPAAWWECYINEPTFRLAQEIPAHAAEFAHICKSVRQDDLRQKALRDIATRLASPLYGKLIDVSEAIRQISNGARAAG